MERRAVWRTIPERPLAGYAAALAAILAVSLLIGALLSWRAIPNSSMLYLIAVLAIAITFGRGPAVLASIAAFLTFNWFFIEPYHTLTIADPTEWVALLLFLLTAVVTGQLAARERRRAREAEQRERENAALYVSLNQALEARAAEAQRREQISATLYELGAQSRALVAKPEPERFLAELASRVVAIFGVRACAVLLPDALGRLHSQSGHTRDGRPVGPLDRAEEGLAEWAFAHERGLNPTRRRQVLFVPLQTGQRRLGLLRVEEAPGRPLGDADAELLTTFAAQAALALDQARLEQEAVRAEVLARADRLKDALLSSVSHDLRTPLAVIRAAAGGLLEAGLPWPDPAHRELAVAIDREAARLNRLVGNLLDMSRIEAGALRPDRSPQALDELAGAVLERLRPLLADHRLDIALPGDLPLVPFDPLQLDQVLTNLLENAAKFSPPGSLIGLRARVVGDELRIAVENDGPPLTPEEEAHIFDKFFQRRGQGFGAGLGLTICKGVVEAHGGRIHGENRRGGGVRFTVALPLAAAPAARGVTA